MEAALGGAQAVAEATGSAAYCRFSGNQVSQVFCGSFDFLRSRRPLSLSADTPAFTESGAALPAAMDTPCTELRVFQTAPHLPCSRKTASSPNFGLRPARFKDIVR